MNFTDSLTFYAFFQFCYFFLCQRTAFAFFEIIREGESSHGDPFEVDDRCSDCFHHPFDLVDIGADSIYGFNREPLQSFSYETAVKNSKLAKKIAELLNSDYLYGAPDFSPYTITKDLIEQHMELSSQFDEIWSMVYMIQCLEMISVDEILDDEQGRVYFATSVGISL